MTESIRPDDVPDFDPWVIPLHGVAFRPTSADAGDAAPALGVPGPGAEVPLPQPVAPPGSETSPLPALTFLSGDELPSEGFHPRLKRSA